MSSLIWDNILSKLFVMTETTAWPAAIAILADILEKLLNFAPQQ